MTKTLKKERIILDAKVSIIEILQHSFVNFLYGLLSGLAIAFVNIGNGYLIFISYYLFKQIESKVLNRNKYISKLGKYYIFPIPSTFGFVLGWYISTLI